MTDPKLTTAEDVLVTARAMAALCTFDLVVPPINPQLRAALFWLVTFAAAGVVTWQRKAVPR